jgi:hypothetical protein
MSVDKMAKKHDFGHLLKPATGKGFSRRPENQCHSGLQQVPFLVPFCIKFRRFAVIRYRQGLHATKKYFFGIKTWIYLTG